MIRLADCIDLHGVCAETGGFCPSLAEGLGFRVRISSYTVDVPREGDHALCMQAAGASTLLKLLHSRFQYIPEC